RDLQKPGPMGARGPPPAHFRRQTWQRSLTRGRPPSPTVRATVRVQRGRKRCAIRRSTGTRWTRLPTSRFRRAIHPPTIRSASALHRNETPRRPKQPRRIRRVRTTTIEGTIEGRADGHASPGRSIDGVEPPRSTQVASPRGAMPQDCGGASYAVECNAARFGLTFPARLARSCGRCVMALTRRRFGLAALGGALALPALARPARAKAPPAGTHLPGIYRMKVGAFEITALSDGWVPLDLKLFTGDSASAAKLLERAFLPTDAVPTAVNEWVVNTGDSLVLVDTGTSNVFAPSLGRMAASLQAAGIDPRTIDAVILTHLHPDHAGGLLTTE